MVARIRDAISEVKDAQLQANKAGEIVKNALQKAKFSVGEKVKNSGKKIDVSKLDASI